MESLKNLVTKQVENNQKWLKIQRRELLRFIHKWEDEFDLTKDILLETAKDLKQKSQILKVFKEFPKNYSTFVLEMERRARFNFFLGNLLTKIAQMIKDENRERLGFIQKNSHNVPVQVKNFMVNKYLFFRFII